VNEKHQDREEDKGQEEVPILPYPEIDGENEGQGDEVMAEGVEEGSPQEKEPGREREEVSELTFTTGDPGADLGHSRGPTSRVAIPVHLRPESSGKHTPLFRLYHPSLPLREYYGIWMGKGYRLHFLHYEWAYRKYLPVAHRTVRAF
jgi:hypothetical protein